MTRDTGMHARGARKALQPMWRRALATMLAFAVLSQPLLAQTAEVTEYYATDALGSIRVVFDATGTVVARNDYTPFGESFNPTGALPGEQFTGQARDGEAALDYFGARYYQSRHGRFSTVDPAYPAGDSLQEPQRWNRYAYAGNGPLTYVDPDGRFFSFFVVFVGVIGGLFLAPSYANAPKPGQQTYPSSNPGSLILGVAAALLGAGGGGRVATGATQVVGTAVRRYAPPAWAAASQGEGLIERANEIAGRAAQVGRNSIQVAREIGTAAERAVGILGPKVRIQIPGTDRFRFPDELTDTVLREVKNVAHLPFTQQLRDYLAYAKEHKLVFELWTRSNRVGIPS